MILLLAACAAPESVEPTPYVGTDACTPCHAEAAATWASSGHAHAFAALEGAQHSHDPSCVPCHVVGDGLGAWPDPRFRDVGCEACHGPGGAHVAAPARAWRTPKDVCLRCHTADRSPDFDRATYWASIRH